MDAGAQAKADNASILQAVQTLEGQLAQESTPVPNVLATSWALVTNLKCASALDSESNAAVGRLISGMERASHRMPALKRVAAEVARFHRSDGDASAPVAQQSGTSTDRAHVPRHGGVTPAEASLRGAADALLRSIQSRRPDGVREGLLALALIMGSSPNAVELSERASILLRRGVADALALSLGHAGGSSRPLPLDVRGVLGFFLASATATAPAYGAALEGLDRSPPAKEARAVLKLVLKQARVATDAAQRVSAALEAAGVPADGSASSAEAAWALARGGTLDTAALVGAKGPRVAQAEQEATANQERVDAMQRLSRTGAWARMLVLGDGVLPSAQWKTMTPSQQQTALRLTITAVERCTETSTLSTVRGGPHLPLTNPAHSPISFIILPLVLQLGLDALRAGESLTRLHLANARFAVLRGREARRAREVRDNAKAPFYQALRRRMNEEQAFQTTQVWHPTPSRSLCVVVWLGAVITHKHSISPPPTAENDFRDPRPGTRSRLRPHPVRGGDAAHCAAAASQRAARGGHCGSASPRGGRRGPAGGGPAGGGPAGGGAARG